MNAILISTYTTSYGILMLSQIRSVRKYSQAIAPVLNQKDFRKVFIKSILWILALIFTIVSIFSQFLQVASFSGFGILKIYQKYDETKKCRLYFSHALQSMIIGWMDLARSIVTLFLKIIEIICLAIIMLLPWRKQKLDESLKGNNNKSFKELGEKSQIERSVIIIAETIQTIIDVPFIILCISINLIAPYRVKNTIRRLQKEKVEGWRKEIMKILVGVIIDIPFIIIFLILCISLIGIYDLIINSHLRYDFVLKFQVKIRTEQVSRRFYQIRNYKCCYKAAIYLSSSDICLLNPPVYLFNFFSAKPLENFEIFLKHQNILLTNKHQLLRQVKLILKFIDRNNTLFLTRVILQSLENAFHDIILLPLSLIFYLVSFATGGVWRLKENLIWFTENANDCLIAIKDQRQLYVIQLLMKRIWVQGIQIPFEDIYSNIIWIIKILKNIIQKTSIFIIDIITTIFNLIYQVILYAFRTLKETFFFLMEFFNKIYSILKSSIKFIFNQIRSLTLFLLEKFSRIMIKSYGKLKLCLIYAFELGLKYSKYIYDFINTVLFFIWDKFEQGSFQIYYFIQTILSFLWYLLQKFYSFLCQVLNILQDLVIQLFYNIQFGILLSLNLFAFWRLPALSRKEQLTINDLTFIYLILDIPWLLLNLLLLFFFPHRFIMTYIPLIVSQEAFPNGQLQTHIRYDLVIFCLNQGLIDILYIPVYIIAAINPWHIKHIAKIILMNENEVLSDKWEQLRREIIYFIAYKGINEVLQLGVIFPISFIMGIYMPMMLKIAKGNYKVAQDPEFIKNKALEIGYSREIVEKIVSIGSICLLNDFIYPQGFKLAVQVTNGHFLMFSLKLPLIIIMGVLSPYRLYAFFIISPHKFIRNFIFYTLEELEQQEHLKHKNLEYHFQQSFTDFLTFLAFILISFTGLRTLYFLTILSANGHISFLNPMILKFASNNPRLALKLNKQRVRLSLKTCIWLSFLELILDLLILPFLICYALFLPWRVSSVISQLKNQYIEVPTSRKKIENFGHIFVQKSIRIEIAVQFFIFIITDTITIILSIILICTLWRAINTYEIISGNQEKSVFRSICSQFRKLCRDILLLGILILELCLLVRAKQVLIRLYRLYKMKRDRKEFQTLNFLKRISRSKQKIDDHQQNKKSIKEMNKNIMSIMLPYLDHKEILRVEGCSRKMALFAGDWPVWKNIYCEYHSKNMKIHKDEREMRDEEIFLRDYRSACKRCYIAKNKNYIEDEISEEIAEYKKGESKIIVEELIFTFLEIPQIFIYVFEWIAFILEKIQIFSSILFENINNAQLPDWINGIQILRNSYLQTLLGLDINHTSDQFNQVLGEQLLSNPGFRSCLYLLKIYIDISCIFSKFFLHIILLIPIAITAGPIGNFRLLQPPQTQQSQLMKSLESLFYIMQTIVIYYFLEISFLPILIPLKITKIKYIESGEESGIFLIILMVFIGLDIQVKILSNLSAIRPCFILYFDPTYSVFKLPFIIYNKVEKCLIFILNKMIDYLSICTRFLYDEIIVGIIYNKVFKKIWKAIVQVCVKINDIQTKIFCILIEYISKALNWIKEFIQYILNFILDVFIPVAQKICDFFIQILEMTWSYFLTFWQFLYILFSELLSLIKTVIFYIQNKIIVVLESIYISLTRLFNLLCDVTSTVISFAKKLIFFICSQITSFLTFLYTFLELFFNKVFQILTSGLQLIGDILIYLYRLLVLVFNFFKTWVQYFSLMIYYAIKFTLTNIWKGIYLTLKVSSVTIYITYFTGLTQVLKMCNQLGTVGELIFVVFSIFYLFWPLYLGHIIYKTDQRYEYYIGAIVLTGALVLRGRKEIKKALS